jgi:hypothetical protein
VLTIELYCPYSTEHNNYRNEYYSAIERVIINAYVPYGSFYTLISNFPELRSLTIDFLIDSRCWNIQSYNIGSMKNFKNVYLKLDGIGFNRFEEIAQNCFQFIEVLFLTIEDDISYLFAQRWEQLISSNMHNLRVFDMHLNNIPPQNRSQYNRFISQCTSSFWIEKLVYISSTQKR